MSGGQDEARPKDQDAAGDEPEEGAVPAAPLRDDAARPDDVDGRDPIDAEHGEKVEGWRRRSAGRRRRAKRPWWIEIPILILSAFLLTFLIQTFVAKVYYVPSASMDTTLHGVESGGDRILVNKMVYDFRDPRPGDIVVFRGDEHWAPQESSVDGATTWYGKTFEALGSVVGISPPNEKDFVKRVIAVGGQTIECCDEQGNVKVDGISLDEHYIHNPLPFVPGRGCTAGPDGLTYDAFRCFGAITVPAGHLVVMGDNRSNSDDSVRPCLGRTAVGMAQDFDQTLGVPECVRLVALDDVIGKAVFIIMPISRWDTLGDPGIDVAGS